MQAQRGFVLVEVVLVALLVTLFSVWAAQSLSRRAHEAAIEAAAVWMQSVYEGTQRYILQYGPALRHADSPFALAAQGYLNWQAPTHSELRAQGLLGSELPLRTRFVGEARVYIVREGNCPGAECRLRPIVYSEQPLINRKGEADEALLAHWLLASRGYGAAVQPRQPSSIRGPAVSQSNPPPGGPVLPVGTVVLGLSTTASDYLRVGDDRDPNFQANASVLGNVSAGGHLFLGQEAQFLSPCNEQGAITRNVRGGLLNCHDGAWESVAHSPGGYATNSLYGCFTPEGRSSANPATGSCSCPSGYALVQISESGTDPFRGITRGYLCVG